MISRGRLVPSLVFLVMAAACGGGNGPEDTEGDGSGESRTTAQPLVYDVTTEVDLTKVADFSAAAQTAIAPLRRLETNPAQAMIDELTSRKAPAAAALMSKIPNALEGQFAGWFNDDAGGKTTADALAGVGDDLSAMMGKFEILSTLDMTPGASKHTIKALSFTRGDEKVTVDSPDLVGAIAPDPVSVNVSGTTASVSPHTFGLPLGGLTSSGLDLLDKDKLAKTGIRFVLGRIIDCGGIAKKTATRCVASLCIGHESEIKDFCDSGLDAMTDATLFALKQLHINPLSLVSGSIQLLDHGDALSGAWNGKVNLGGGDKDISSVLTGKRIPKLP